MPRWRADGSDEQYAREMERTHAVATRAIPWLALVVLVLLLVFVAGGL